jgi:type II secretory pathway pseudopilin PulG
MSAEPMHSSTSNRFEQWRERRRSEAGDTLIELLIAMAIMTLTGASILGAFVTSINASTQHRQLATINTLLRSYAEVATYQIQLQPSPLYQSCATPSTYTSGTYAMSNLPSSSGFTITLSTIQYWNSSTKSFGATCVSGSIQPELLTITATGTAGNLSAPSTSLNFIVDDYIYSVTTAAPVFTSANNATEALGQSWNFPVTTTGTPSPALTQTSSLPNGVSFVDNGDGTGTLSGTTAVGAGNYSLVFKANNSVGAIVSQSFTLSIVSVPTFTSAATETPQWTHGVASTFTVTASSSPNPSFSAASLPVGVTLIDNGNGSATLKGTTATVAGTYTITITANNGPFNAQQTFTLVVK